MREPPSRGAAVRGVAVASVAGLCLVVAGVAAVAMVAESIKTWQWYFLMERTIALATPVALTLAAVALVGGFALVATAPGE